MRCQPIILLLILTALISCNQKKFPEPVTQKVNSENIKLNSNFLDTELAKRDSVSLEKNNDLRLDSLMSFYNKYEAKAADFSIGNLKKSWNLAQVKISTVDLEFESAKKWVNATGLLFELTGDAIYSEELERVIYTSFKRNFSESEIEQLAEPYVFTRYLDQIHVNLFIPSEMNYSHTLGGDVKIQQETNYPESGSVKLKFSMTKRRYIELFIRIPSWAENSEIIVKGVKYYAPPGGYCKIAKKWREGDVAEIQFPIVKKPDYLK